MIEIHFPLEKKFQGEDKISYKISNGKKNKPLKLDDEYFYYFQGKNGVGKTTLLNIIAFLTDFDGGVGIDKNILYINKEKKDKSYKDKSMIRKNHFSYIFQDPHIINIYNIQENLKIVNSDFNFKNDMDLIFNKVNNLSINSSEKKYIQSKLGKIINEKNNSPFYLSGGEKQLLSFIRALIKPSNIIFADEPWAAMDQFLKEFIEQQLYQYLNNKDIFESIRNRSNISQLNKNNTVIAIAHIFHHSKETSICGVQDKNFNYRIDIKKINKKITDKSHLELIRFKIK